MPHSHTQNAGCTVCGCAPCSFSSRLTLVRNICICGQCANYVVIVVAVLPSFPQDNWKGSSSVIHHSSLNSPSVTSVKVVDPQLRLLKCVLICHRCQTCRGVYQGLYSSVLSVFRSKTDLLENDISLVPGVFSNQTKNRPFRPFPAKVGAAWLVS